MEPTQIQEQAIDQTHPSPDKSLIKPSQHDMAVTPQSQEMPCPTCNNGANYMDMSFICALGQTEARFPRLSVEKEFAQVARRSETTGKTDRQVFQEVLSKPENRYLVRQMCWVFSVQGLETYLLKPSNPADYDLLVDALRPTYSPGDIDCIVGVRGPVALAEYCNGLMVPIVAVDNLYPFSRDVIIQAIPKPEKAEPDQFRRAAEEVFDRIMQMTDNAGATDEHRALNYLAVRDPSIYAKAAEQFGLNSSLTGVETRLSSLSTTRKIIEVIFAYTNRNTDFLEKFCVRVDATEEFPFLVSKLSPYFDR